MDRVHAAVEAGRCVVAVGAHLLKDSSVLLAISDRPGISAVTLSGPPVKPFATINADALARATAQPDGVIVFVEPESKDQAGVEAISKLVRSSQHKPMIVVVSRSANVLTFQFQFRGLPLQVEKARGAQFLSKLPKTGAAPVPAPSAKAAKKDKKPQGVRRLFVGRDDEVAALTELLGEGGPIVVHGPEGIGRNTLVDHVLGASELTRHVDVVLGRGARFDALAARLAELTAEVGVTTLADVLANGDATPVQIIDAAVAALTAAEDLATHALVIQPLEVAIGRDRDFFRKDRLASLTQALLGNRYPLRLIFIAEGPPQAFDHAENQAARLFPVEGIKGRFFHEIFEAYNAPEFSRDLIGPMSERLFGHPMAVVHYAVAMRERADGAKLAEDPKFLKAARPHDTSSLRKLLRKRVDKLPADERAALAMCAHARLPMTGSDLADMKLSRKMRLKLLSLGLLDQGGTDTLKTYRVHPLVRSCLRIRETLDFDILVAMGRLHAAKGKDLEGADRVAHVQEANRCFVAGRNGRETIKLKYPDYDPEIESATGMIRSKRPHFDMAQQRIGWVLNQAAGNADAHLLKMELLRRLDAPKEAQEAAIAEAQDKAPVAEVFQEACTYYLVRRARPKAIAVLEKAVEVLPNEARLKTRLASLLMRQGRRPEALELLQQAMDQAPMLPDPYGLMGMARFDEGVEALPRAEELLREAVRLAPQDRVQIPRLVTVLLAKARVAPVDQMAAIRDEARELLAPITRDDSKSAEGFLMLARLERESNNLDRADWLLKQARKHIEKRKGLGNRIRLESARVSTQRGDLDKAEADIRQLIERDQSNPTLFMALAEVLEARQLFIPAHAELLRASERVAATTLEGQHVAAQLARLQAVIEAQAASVGVAPTPTEQVEVGPKAPRPVDHARTIRRPGKKAEDKADDSQAEEPAADGEAPSPGAQAEETVKPVLDQAADLVAKAAGAVVETVATIVDDVQGKDDPEGEAKAGQEAEEAVSKVSHTVAEGLASAVQVVTDTVVDAVEAVSDAVDGEPKKAADADAEPGPQDLGPAGEDDATEEVPNPEA